MLLIGTIVCLNNYTKAQSLVMGGFTSFNLSSDSSQISSNSGGVLIVNNKTLSCVQLQSGNSIGGFELFSKDGLFSDDCKPINSSDKLPNLSIYPNPGFGLYTLCATDASSFYITDMTGKTVYNQTDLDKDNQLYSFDISHLAEACYIVFVRLNNGRIKSLPIIKTIK